MCNESKIVTTKTYSEGIMNELFRRCRMGWLGNGPMQGVVNRMSSHSFTPQIVNRILDELFKLYQFI